MKRLGRLRGGVARPCVMLLMRGSRGCLARRVCRERLSRSERVGSINPTCLFERCECIDPTRGLTLFLAVNCVVHAGRTTRHPRRWSEAEKCICLGMRICLWNACVAASRPLVWSVFGSSIELGFASVGQENVRCAISSYNI